MSMQHDAAGLEGGFDVIVVGSGVAGLTAAVVAAAEGSRVVLLEAAALIGGTSAISGGMIWLPGSRDHGDSVDAARRYLDEAAPAASDPVREAFLNRAAEARTYLEARSSLRLAPVPTYPDYNPDLPGATLRGRCFEALPFNGASLGSHFGMLRPPLPEFMLFGGMMVSRADLPHFTKVFRDPRATWRVATLVADYAIQRLRHRRGTRLYLGNALTGRLLKSALDVGVTIRTKVAVTALRGESRVVNAVEIVMPDGTRLQLAARKAVILATGGFSHDAELRLEHLPEAAQSTTVNVPSGATAGARLARPFGATIDASAENRAFWVPGSRFTRNDGTTGVFPHTVTDRAKPGLIAVNRTGQRFANEARPYHDFALAMLRGAPVTTPAYLICDAAFLWNYGLGRIKPFSPSTRAACASGYLIDAPTIGALAERLGLPRDELEATIGSYNEGAVRGEDPAFGRGGDAYQRHLGDSARQPNPCVAPITKAPFYAVAVMPADMGTAAGIKTDSHARVIAGDGEPVTGLYACGNDMNSVMAGFYPGPGITLGPALTFGYIAGRHASVR
jgi:succinate dehydrogenase/fumarate reductase flavoprotein subunit